MMELRDLMIILVVFSISIIGINLFMKDFINDYVAVPSELENINFTDKVEYEINKTSNALQSSQITGTPLDIGLFVVTGIYNIFKFFIVDIINIYTYVISQISTYLMLPSWFIGSIIILITLFLIFEIISAIIKWRV